MYQNIFFKKKLLLISTLFKNIKKINSKLKKINFSEKHINIEWRGELLPDPVVFELIQKEVECLGRCEKVTR